LSLVRRIVTAHGGRVSVASHPGTTTFTIALPVASEAGSGSLAREAGVVAHS
jgi:signal transduction histidine kinase